MEDELNIAESLLLLTMNLQNFCEKTENKSLNRELFSIKFKILLLVKNQGKISPSIIVDNLNIAKSNIAIFSKNLIEEGLISCEHDEFDRRIIYYCLTQKGEKYISNNIENFNKYINSNIDEKQQKIMAKNIKNLSNNLIKIGDKNNVKNI